MRLLIVGLMAVAVTVAACGKRGDPKPPEGVQNTYPKSYPKKDSQ